MADLLKQALDIWQKGGWAMVPLAIVSFMLFYKGMEIRLALKDKAYRRVAEPEWRGWIGEAGGRKGPIGRIIHFAMQSHDLEEIGARFAEIRIGELKPFARDLRFMKVCVAAAPLLGLLGTVTGMFATFQGLSMGGGGEKTMDMVSGGISEALITTQTGLVIALPGYFWHYQLARERDRYAAFLAHMESLCAQFIHKCVKKGRKA
ncbi:MAG: MotA/TolQ/ExbB proton channel family protein [Verrucomicrobiae bacterium]|nr:MotA/TolQ/ExbB proton channel family protein [Verrucomicrobiae bacterium]